LVEIKTQALLQTAACVPKVVVEAQLIVLLDQLRCSAATSQETSVLLISLAVHAVLFVTLDQEQAHAVQTLGAETLTNVADLAVRCSIPAIQTVLVQLRLTWQFLQGYLPVMVLAYNTDLKQTAITLSGTAPDTCNLYSSLML
jgi:hypothetical protein